VAKNSRNHSNSLDIPTQLSRRARRFSAYSQPLMMGKSWTSRCSKPARLALTSTRDMGVESESYFMIYVSTDSRTHGSTYNSYVLAMMEKYGSPDKLEARPSRNGANDSPGDNLRWSKNGQYIEANGIERSVTVGSDSLDAKMDELKKGQHI
jgi:hypothetical protein